LLLRLQLRLTVHESIDEQGTHRSLLAALHLQQHLLHLKQFEQK
jgi:hypothetical protein